MIILLNESGTEDQSSRSIGIYRIATALRQEGYKVEVIDFVSHWDYHDLIRYIDSFTDIEWIGVSTKFNTITNTINEKKGWFLNLSHEDENKLLAYYKSKNIKLVLGGASVAHVKKYAIDKFDFIILGYADIAVIELHKHIISGSYIYVTEHISNTKIIDADINYGNINMANIQTYFHETDFINKSETLPLEISRGCIFKCAYCNFPYTGKKKGTYIKDKESLKLEILDRYSKYNITQYYFLDDTFNDDVDKMRMLKEIREETQIPFEFWAYGRLDLLRANPDQQELISKIGWKSIAFGIETLDHNNGKLIGKGMDPVKLSKFLSDLSLKTPDTDFLVHFISGLPNDTTDSMYHTFEWAKERLQDKTNCIVRVHFIPLVIYNNEDNSKKINSKMSENPGKYGYVTSKINENLLVLNWTNKNLFDREQSRILSFKLNAELKNFFKKPKWKKGNAVDIQKYIFNKMKYRKLI